MATSQSSKRSAANPYSTGGRSAYQVPLRRRSPRYSAASAAQAAPGSAYGGPAARQVAGEAGTSAEASYPRYQVPTGVEAGEQETYGGTANAPVAAPSERISTPEMMTERQGIIANRALGPVRERGTLFGDLLSGLSPEKANPNFDPNAPIGGENIPYESTSGLRGFFQRFGGNRANELNLAAQAQQAAEWKAEDALAKERKAKTEDYRTQKMIDAEIATAAAEKQRAHEVSMLEKTQQAQRDVIRAQQEFTGAQNDKERSAAWDRLVAAHQNAVTLQNNALASTAAEGAAGRQLQTNIANLQARMQDFIARNAVHFGPNGMYARGADIFTTTTPMPDKSGKMPVPESVPLTGPKGEGEQVPQIPVGGATTPTRFEMPQGFTQLPPGGGVMRQGGAAPLPVSTPAAAKPAVTPARAAAAIPQTPSPLAEPTMLGRFRQAMPSLNLERAPGPGVTSPYLTEGELGQRVMEQIAYPLRASVAQDVKSQFENPEFAASVLERRPMWRFRRPGATEMSQAREAGELLRQMYGE